MEILGYLITLSFLKDNPALLNKLDDFTVNLERVDNLANYIRWEVEHKKGVLTDINDIQNRSYIKKGDVGTYYSTNLRDYIFHGNVSSHEEGAIVKLNFKPDHQPSDGAPSSRYDEPLGSNKTTISLLLRHSSKEDEPALKEAINEHLDKVEGRASYG